MDVEEGERDSCWPQAYSAYHSRLSGATLFVPGPPRRRSDTSCERGLQGSCNEILEQRLQRGVHMWW